MIRVFMQDGLGNQMFQYAFARAVSLENGAKLCLDTRHFLHDPAGRAYSLHHLRISPNVKIKQYSSFQNLLFKLYRQICFYLYRRVKRKSPPFHPDFGRHIIYHNFGSVHNYKPFNYSKASKNLWISGQFQSYKWFEHHSDVIREELKVKDEPSPANKELIKEFQSKNSVCVHIRMGDYLNSEWSFLNVCTYSYFYQAMKAISQTEKDPVFLFFPIHTKILSASKKSMIFRNFMFNMWIWITLITKNCV